MVDQRPGAEFRDRQEARARDVFVAPAAPAPARHVGGNRQPGEIVPRQESLRREIAVGVEVPLVDALSLGEQPDLAFGLSAQPARMIALRLRTGMVADDVVVQIALANGRAIEVAPADARLIEVDRDLAEHLVHPSFVEPGGLGKLGADVRDHRRCPQPRRVTPPGTAQHVVERAPDRQRQRSILGIQFQNVFQRLPEIGLRRLHPHRVDVRADQVAIAEVDAGRRYRSGDHPDGLAVEVLIVRAAPRAVGEDQRRLPAATGAPAALSVVGRRGRDVAQVDEVQLLDVDAQFHRRRAEQQRETAIPEARLPLLAVLRRHLRGVFAPLQNALEVYEAAVALDEVTVDLLRKRSFVEQPDVVDRPILTVIGQPAQGVRVELIARIVGVASAPYLLHDAVALQGQEQEANQIVGLRATHALVRQVPLKPALEVLSVGAVRGHEQTALFASAPGARPGDDRVGQLPLVLQIPGRTFEETRFRLLNQIVLLARIKHVDLYGELSPQQIEQRTDQLLARIGRNRAERIGDGVLVKTGFPQLGLPEQPVVAAETLVVEPEQSAILQVGRGDAPTTFQIAVEEILQHLAQGVFGALARRSAHLGIGGVVLERQLHRGEDVTRQVAMPQTRRRPPRAGSTECGAQQGDLNEVVEVAGLQRGVLPVVGKAQQLARRGVQLSVVL